MQLLSISHSTYWTKEEDSLSLDWFESLQHFGILSPYVWINPPYSHITPWVDKAIEQASKGIGSVMLVMADPSVKWFAKAVEYATEIRFVTKGRIAFLEDGVPRSGNNKGSVFFVFSPKMLGNAKFTWVNRKELLDKGNL